MLDATDNYWVDTRDAATYPTRHPPTTKNHPAQNTSIAEAENPVLGTDLGKTVK